MKSTKLFSVLVVGVLVFASACRDFVDPIIPYSDFDTGTYLRTIRSASPSSVAPSLTFNFFDLENSDFQVTVEAVSEVGGTNVDNVTVSVRHFRITDTGPVNTPAQPVLVQTVPGSAFTSNGENRFTRATISLTAAEAASAVGFTFDQLEGGDFFDISLELTTTDGRVFNNANLSADVQGGFFYDSPFFYRVGVVCPSNISEQGDEWNASTVSNFGNFSAVVTVNPVGDIRYVVSDVSAGLYAGFGFNTVQEGIYEDACNTLNWVSAGTTQFSLASPGRTGSFDPATGTLVVPWFDSGNGIEGTTTLTKR